MYMYMYTDTLVQSRVVPIFHSSLKSLAHIYQHKIFRYFLGQLRIHLHVHVYTCTCLKTCIYSVWCLVSLVVSLPRPSPSY